MIESINAFDYSTFFDYCRFLMPHSHMDTSWVQTFDDYFNSLATNIFRSVVTKLSSMPAARFIFSEVINLQQFSNYNFKNWFY